MARAMSFQAMILLTMLTADAPKVAAPAEPLTEVTKQFGAKIQPLLANACAACHSTAGCGSFVLRRSNPGTAVAADTVSHNLAAAMSQIDRKQPDHSPLLVKAIAAHGGARQPAIKDANAPAYKNLEQWVRLVTRGEAAQNHVSGSSHDNPGKPIDPFDPAIFNNKKN